MYLCRRSEIYDGVETETVTLLHKKLKAFKLYHVILSVYSISSKYGTPSNYGTLYLELQNVWLHKSNMLAVVIFFI